MDISFTLYMGSLIVFACVVAYFKIREEDQNAKSAEQSV